MSHEGGRAAVLLERLGAIVGSTHVLHDPDQRAPFEWDWTRRYHGECLAVVRPGDTAEVAGVLRICRDLGVPVVPQGGNTGLVGGSVPAVAGALVLSTRRLRTVEHIDVNDREVIAGAGVTLGALRASTLAHGLTPRIDLASRDSATLGGMVATNAGGIYAMRYGPMRSQVLGIEAVTADGTVVTRLPAPGKDNTGYSLSGLLAGSEGTLAVITRVQVRLGPVHRHRAVALLGFAAFEPALACASLLANEVGAMVAMEGFFAEGVRMVTRHTGLPLPLESPCDAYLLVECAGEDDPLPELAAAVGRAPGVVASAVATDRPGRERLWAYRERHTEAISAEGVPHKLDVTVPAGRLAEFRARVAETVAQRNGVRAIMFGHIGDGNLHVNLLGADEHEGVDRDVLALAAAMGGSISAEHGVGRAKIPYLHLTRSDADLAWMRAVKTALDPDWRLNPGVMFPSARPSGSPALP